MAGLRTAAHEQWSYYCHGQFTEKFVTPIWHFNSFRRGDQRNDPISHALFSQDEVADLAGSVVREAIQNSLDAGPVGSTSIRVRFTLRRRMAPSVESFSPFLNGLWEHLSATETGLDTPPTARGSVPLLTIEDFGTSGLTGDPEQWDPLDGGTNGFFLFFHATGTSGKSGESRGRWGVGKFVFPLAGRANTWFGLTVRPNDSQPLLMGRCVLKTHRSSGTTCHPDGRWGLVDDGFVRPVVGADPLIVAYARACAISRTAESGLSVTIPWVREELTVDSIRDAVVREYFLPLLRNELVVEIDSDGDLTRIDGGSVSAVAELTGDPALIATIGLATDAVAFDVGRLTMTLQADADGAPKWSADLLSDEQKTALAAQLDGGGVIGIRVPLRVRPRGAEARPSHFDVFVRAADSLGRMYPLIVREGITVPKARTAGISDCVAIVLADDGPLVGLIGDSENPAHTELLHKLIKDKYTYAKASLDLLRETPSGLVRALREGETQDDPFLLSDLFPAPDDPGTGRTDRQARRRGQVTPPPLPPPPPRPRRFRIDAVVSGFSVVGQAGQVELPAEIDVACAYEVRRGKPLRQYSSLDFTLADGSIAIDAQGATIISAEGNRLKFRPDEPGFRVTVTGFDVNRDVYVRADAE